MQIYKEKRNYKRKNAKIPRQCKFKRKNANIKGKTLKSHDNANLKGENIVYMMSIRTFIDYVYK